MATIRGTNSRDVLRGGATNDLLAGFDGNDDLYGNGGNDNLYGGAGADRLDGGVGNDWVLYADGAIAGVNVSLATRRGAGGHATGDVLIGIENIQGSKFADTLTGDALGNVLDGGAGNDKLYGGAGGDTIVGGAGADRIDGGLGTDWVVYSSGATAGIFANLTTRTGSGGDLLYNIENVEGTKFNDTLTGDANANVLNGGLGNDTLRGGSGDDNLVGDAGADTLDGGIGRDWALYQSATTGVSINLETHIGIGGVAQGDRLFNIENVEGSKYNDTLTGDVNDNVLNGGAGNDTLRGGQGNDVLVGGTGGDLLDGGAGLGDWVYYGFGATGGVTINLLLDTATGGTATGDRLDNVENVQGTQFVDNLTGDGNSNSLEGGGGNDHLNGGNGDDTLTGGVGGDTLTGGDGSDTAVYSDSTAGVIINLFTHTATGGTAQGDVLSGIENITGSAHGDQLFGDSASNTLVGGAGNDILKDDAAATGTDTDVFRPGSGSDTITGDGNDILDYRDATSGVGLDLTTGAGTGSGFAAGDSFTGIASAYGGAFADTLTTGSGTSALGAVLYGFGGNDTLTINGAFQFAFGGDDNDTIFLKGSNQSANGDDGVDTLDATSATGSATLRGGAGNDILKGGGSNDTLFGGAGADNLDGGGGADRVDYSDLTFAAGVTVGITVNLSTGTASDGDQLANIENVTGTSLNDTITGDTNGNVLNGGGGDDALNGGDGDDTLLGGAGADTINGGAGSDRADYSDLTFATGVTTGVTVDLVAGTASGGDLLSFIENVTGTRVDDTIRGNGEVNSLLGGDGNDLLESGGGGTTSAAGDFLSGGLGNDTLVVTGTASADANLSGGAGDDTLTGHATGRDIFHIEKLTGTDTITNFLRGNGDLLRVDRSDFGFGTSFDASELVNAASGHVAVGDAAQLIFDQSSSQLWYDADGTGSGAAVQLATLNGITTSLALSDFFDIA